MTEDAAAAPALRRAFSVEDQAAVLDSLPEAILVRELDGIVLFWNAGAERLYGWAKEQVLGLPLHHALQSSVLSGSESPDESLLHSGNWSGRLRQTCSNGTSRVVDAQCKLQRDENGNPVRVIETHWPLTQGEMPMLFPGFPVSLTPAQCSLLLDSMPGLVSYIDRDLRYRYVNRVYAEWFGRPLDEFIGSSMEEMLGSDAMKLIQPRIDRVLTGESLTWSDFLPYRTIAGRYVQANYVPDLGLDGSVAGFMVLVEDIHARTVAEKSLGESEHRFRNMADHAPVMIWVTDATGSCTYLSRSWYEFTGQTPETGLGFGWLNALHSEDRVRNEQIYLEANRTKSAFRLEYRLKRVTGDWCWMLDAAVPRLSEDSSFLGYIGSVIDISDRKLAEETLIRQAEELARSNADLQQFAYVTSHDLQEPLRNITNFAQLFSRRHAAHLSPEATQWLTYIVSGAARMKSLIDALLSFSRLVNAEAVKPIPVDTGAAFDWALMNLEALISENEASIFRPDRMPMVEGDLVQLVQLFQNLLANAVRYRSPANAPQVNVSVELSPDRKEWKFAITDNGIGIAPEYQERIFEVFRRLHGREIPGTGIGLAICRRIVQRHGGRIWVESVVHQGSTFFFTLPISGPIQ